MRKIKKINGYLVVKFNARELREYEGTALGEYGVIDAELYTGNLDIDRGAMEYHKDKKVSVKWNSDDMSKLYVYTLDGKKICEAVSAEVLGYGPHCSQEALEKLMRSQKRQYRETVDKLEEFTTPYEQRVEQGRPSDAVGKLNLTIKAERRPKVVSLPVDKEYRSEAADQRKKRAAARDEFLQAKAGAALAQLRAMNE